MEWCRFEFKESKRFDEKSKELVHYEVAAEQLGVAVESLAGYPQRQENPHEFPLLMQPLWEMFTELTQTRTSGFSANPIQYSEIIAWCQLTGIKLHPWELRAIRLLDRAYLDTAHAEKKE